MKKLDRLLTILIASSFGGFLGMSLPRYIHYRKYPELYGPGYMPFHKYIIINLQFFLLAVVIFVIIKLIIKRKLKKQAANSAAE